MPVRDSEMPVHNNNALISLFLYVFETFGIRCVRKSLLIDCRGMGVCLQNCVVFNSQYNLFVKKNVQFINMTMP